ncbi:hypothetical protein KIPB_004358 [Kipferlia bialata]|uniref:Uncharacterized protein n=1 Tax=Kipferlia bialata TaxID=797122 RepID=A0A9K3GHE4_9EUKA|nr:hypothetical protein KIPB_004358 [Kipferlia bialata]|eukprot:g4358.t1
MPLSLSWGLSLIGVASVLYGVAESLRSGTHKAIIMHWLHSHHLLHHKAVVYGNTRSWSLIGSATSSLASVPLLYMLPASHWLLLLAMVPYVVGLLVVRSYPSYLNKPVSSTSTPRGPTPYVSGKDSLVQTQESETGITDPPAVGMPAKHSDLSLPLSPGLEHGVESTVEAGAYVRQNVRRASTDGSGSSSDAYPEDTQVSDASASDLAVSPGVHLEGVPSHAHSHSETHGSLTSSDLAVSPGIHTGGGAVGEDHTHSHSETHGSLGLGIIDVPRIDSEADREREREEEVKETVHWVESLLKGQRQGLKVLRAVLSDQACRHVLFSSATFDAVALSIKDYIQPVVDTALTRAIPDTWEGYTNRQLTDAALGVIYTVLYLASSSASHNAYRLLHWAGHNTQKMTTIVYYTFAVAIGVQGALLVCMKTLPVLVIYILLYLCSNARRPVMVARVTQTMEGVKQTGHEAQDAVSADGASDTQNPSTRAGSDGKDIEGEYVEGKKGVSLDNAATVLSIEAQLKALCHLVIAPCIGGISSYMSRTLFSSVDRGIGACLVLVGGSMVVGGWIF